jgi:hypothetical protein
MGSLFEASGGDEASIYDEESHNRDAEGSIRHKTSLLETYSTL